MHTMHKVPCTRYIIAVEVYNVIRMRQNDPSDSFTVKSDIVRLLLLNPYKSRILLLELVDLQLNTNNDKY